MRHVRILGLCLAVVCVVGAMAAASASARKSVWEKFKYCPVASEVICTYQQSEAGSEFKAGNIEVKLEKPITLQGGLLYLEEGPHAEESQFIPAAGAPTLVPVKQKAPSLEEVIDPSKLSGKELRRYNQDVARGVTKGNVTIELAGSELYLNTGNLIEESGPALTLPVKVKLTSPFLGPNCYVGSDANPIEIELTTGPSNDLHGFLGHLYTIEEGTILVFGENTLVNGTYSSPGVEGCGREDGANEALDAKIGLPSGEGQNNTTIKGSILIADAEEVISHR